MFVLKNTYSSCSSINRFYINKYIFKIILFVSLNINQNKCESTTNLNDGDDVV